MTAFLSFHVILDGYIFEKIREYSTLFLFTHELKCYFVEFYDCCKDTVKSQHFQ